jgi:MFS family permease
MQQESAQSLKTSFDARAWWLLALVCGVLFLDGLDVSMVGVALPSIGSELGLEPSSLQWVVSGYILGYGGLLLLGGRAADLLGRRRVLLGGLAVFLVASFVGGLANDGNTLIATRFIKGAAAAFTAPAVLSIITTTFAEGPARNKALSIYAAVGASGWSLGLVFGGALTELGWRYTFFMPVPIALAILLLLPRFLDKDEPAVRVSRSSFDFSGTATLAVAMLGLVYTIVEAPDIGWGATQTLLSFAAVAMLLTAFVLIEQRSANPLVRLGILKSAARQLRRDGAARQLVRVPVHRHPLHAEPEGLVADRDGARLPPGGVDRRLRLAERRATGE